MQRAAARRGTIALAVLAAAALLVADQRIVAGERALLEAVNGLPRVLGAPLEVVMQLGTVNAGLLVVAALVVSTPRRGAGPALAVLVAVGIAWRLDNVLKEIIERPRPPGLVDDLIVREAPSGFAFPSGHTTMAFALAASLHPSLPSRWRALAWTVAALAGVARMYVGVHWPMDLVGGAALGIVIGSTAVVLTSRYRRPPG